MTKYLYIFLLAIFCSCKMAYKSGKKNFFCDCQKWQTQADKEFLNTQQNQNNVVASNTIVKSKKIKHFKYKRKKANYSKTKGKQKNKFDKIMKCFKW